MSIICLYSQLIDRTRLFFFFPADLFSTAFLSLHAIRLNREQETGQVQASVLCSPSPHDQRFGQQDSYFHYGKFTVNFHHHNEHCLVNISQLLKLVAIAVFNYCCDDIMVTLMSL